MMVSRCIKNTVLENTYKEFISKTENSIFTNVQKSCFLLFFVLSVFESYIFFV